MGRPLISERTVLDAVAAGKTSVAAPADAMITAQARDVAKSRGVVFVAPAPATEAASASPPAAPMAIAIGCDHAGFDIKPALADHAASLGWTVIDLGTNGTASADYPDFAFAVAHAVQSGAARFGLMIDGVGVGSAIVANKMPGVRAALCPDVFSAFNARAHNDANVLTLGSRTMGVESCKRILAEFLSVEFAGGRHAARVQKILDVEARFLPGT